jgi:hypothetical protein
MDRMSTDTKHSTYSGKYVARLVIGLLLISVALADRVARGNLILPDSVYSHRADMALTVDLLVFGSGLSLCFSRSWRISRSPIVAGLALTLLPAVNAIRNVETWTVTKDLSWIWILVCVVLIGFIAWATSGE